MDLKSKKGITILALSVTIIILLILNGKKQYGNVSEPVEIFKMVITC